MPSCVYTYMYDTKNWAPMLHKYQANVRFSHKASKSSLALLRFRACRLTLPPLSLTWKHAALHTFQPTQHLSITVFEHLLQLIKAYWVDRTVKQSSKICLSLFHYTSTPLMLTAFQELLAHSICCFVLTAHLATTLLMRVTQFSMYTPTHLIY